MRSSGTLWWMKGGSHQALKKPLRLWRTMKTKLRRGYFRESRVAAVESVPVLEERSLDCFFPRTLGIGERAKVAHTFDYYLPADDNDAV